MVVANVQVKLDAIGPVDRRVAGVLHELIGLGLQTDKMHIQVRIVVRDTDFGRLLRGRRIGAGSETLVRHATFGEGVVMGCEPDGTDVQITVGFRDGIGLKRLLLSFAPLQKIEG